MSLNDRLAAYFRERPNTWVDGRDLATVAGAYAWRSRCSELRTQRGMTIENRQRHYDGFTISEYRWVPPTEPEQLPLSDQWSVGV